MIVHHAWKHFKLQKELAVFDKVRRYFSDTKKFFYQQLLSQKHLSANGFACIGITPQEFVFVFARDNHNETVIELCEAHDYKDENNFAEKLMDIVKQNNLQNTPCSLLLQPEDYQILITDALPVKEAEFQSAIRWKIKDQIRYPLNDVVIDHFNVPQMKTNVNKIMVVVAQASRLVTLSELIRTSGLNLQYIDVPELALRNIAILYEKNDQPSALIYVQEKAIQLLFLANRQIYISRLLKITLNTEDINTINIGMERLAAEIFRSFDYYQSLWTMATPAYFLFASTKEINAESVSLLSQRINVPVEIINLNDIIRFKQALSLTEQGKFLPIIGGALRHVFLKERSQHATAS